MSYDLLPDGQYTFSIHETNLPKKKKTSKVQELQKIINKKDEKIRVLEAWIVIYKYALKNKDDNKIIELIQE